MVKLTGDMKELKGNSTHAFLKGNAMKMIYADFVTFTSVHSSNA